METPVTINTLQRFKEVITFWNTAFDYPTYQKDNRKNYIGKNVSFRRILMKDLNWHIKVHYEFRCYNETNEIGIAFHSDPRPNDPFNWNSVRKAVQNFRDLKIKNISVDCSANNRIMKSGL